MIRYVFKDDPFGIKNADKADPQAIGEALAASAERNSGRLLPRAVLKEARDEAHPIHKHLEWNDVVAADNYRLDQVRRIIRVVRIESPEEDAPTRAFYSVSDKSGVAYHTAKEVIGSAEMQAAVLRQARDDLLAWERRYQDIHEALSLVEAARDEVAKKLKVVEEYRPAP